MTASRTSRRRGITPCASNLLLVALLFLFAGPAAATKLELGFVPILPMAQLYVMQGEGWAKSAKLDLHTTPYSEGPAMVQALVDGKLDVAYFGIAPAIVTLSKGADIKVVASSIVEQVALIARGDLALYMLSDPAAGLVKFAKKKARKPRIASFAVGSVPDTVFRHWLLEVAKLPLESVDIVPLGAEKLQAALLAGEVDGASTLEPILTVVAASDRTAKVVLDGAQMMPNQPGAVLAVRGALARDKPAVVRKLVELHLRATEFLIRYPDRAARHAFVALSASQPQLTEPLVERALASPYSKFVADPYRIVDSTRAMYEFQRRSGTLSQTVALDALFDVRFYDRVLDAR